MFLGRRKTKKKDAAPSRNSGKTSPKRQAKDALGRIEKKSTIDRTRWQVSSEDLDASEAGKTLRKTLLSLFKSPDYKPPVLPRIAMEVHELTGQTNITFAKIGEVLEMDPVLTGRVLQIVNSPFYGGQSKMISLEHAIVRLGLATIRDIVWQVAMDMRVFRVERFSEQMDFLRRHSVATARVAKLIGSRTGLMEGQAFLIGLMHDIGMAGLLIALGEGKTPEARFSLDLLWPAINDLHEETGGILARLWKLPENIREAIEYHHKFKPDQTVTPAMATACLAEWIANEIEAGILDDKEQKSVTIIDYTMPKMVEASAKALHLDSTKLDRLIDDAREMAEKLDE